MAQKFSTGAFCFYRVGSQCQPMTPHQIEAQAQQHGISPAIVPAYSGDRNQVSRAISQTSSQMSKGGWFLDAIKRSQHEVVYGIVRTDKDQRKETLDYTHESTLRWTDDGGNGTHVEGVHEIAGLVDATYQQLRGKVCAGDWTESLTAYLVGHCYAQAMRDDGRVYYIPASHLDKLAPLTAFLAAVGIALVVCEIETEAVQVVQQTASEGLADQLQALQDAVSAFDGQQKPSNYTHRLEEITRLKARANAYHAALGIGVEQAQSILAQLAAQVQGLLDIRQNTVVHRSGKVSSVGTPGSAAVDTLARAFDKSNPAIVAYPATYHSINRDPG